MTAADTLTVAGNLLARFGHSPAEAHGCELAGFSLAGAVEQAASDQVAERSRVSRRFALLDAWVKTSAACGYLLDVIGHDPSEHSPAGARRLLACAGDGAGGRPLGTAWAVAVCEQAAQLAAASSRVRPVTAAAITAEMVAVGAEGGDR